LIVPVILSGGSGARLWPLSREAYPKQFLPLMNGRSLFQKTLERLGGLAGCDAPLLVCNDQHRFLAAEQLRQLGARPMGIMLEPVGRNTAPATACAAIHAAARSENALLLVLPADHVIRNVAAFQSAVSIAREQAEEGHLVTFGIVADRPETGFGYIRRGDVKNTTGARCFHVEEFVEKPDADTARRYVNSGEYYWNSGMFMFRAGVYLHELAQHAPAILSACRKAYQNAVTDLDFLRLAEEPFTACPGDSIDYAVMEKTEAAVVVPLDAGWSDLGSWSALYDISGADASGNVISGDVVQIDSHNCYLHSEDRLLATVGIRDHVVVETADAVLVAHKARVQDVKAVVDRLKAEGRSEHIFHNRVYRPWGSYQDISVSDRFRAKRITVNSGASLSLQLHHHRAEHWVVVRGTARITRDGEIMVLNEDESAYIPIGMKHRLENPGHEALEVIEVQTGDYLGEDDIVRFDDAYGRAG